MRDWIVFALLAAAASYFLYIISSSAAFSQPPIDRSTLTYNIECYTPRIFQGYPPPQCCWVVKEFPPYTFLGCVR